jgi:hypothetical protein
MVTVSRDCENDGLAPHSIPLLGVVNAIKAIVEAMQKERTTGSEALHCAGAVLTEPSRRQFLARRSAPASALRNFAGGAVSGMR